MGQPSSFTVTKFMYLPTYFTWFQISEFSENTRERLFNIIWMLDNEFYKR